MIAITKFLQTIVVAFLITVLITPPHIASAQLKALESTQLENFDRLSNILEQNTSINRQTDDIMVRTEDLQTMWRQDNPAQWRANTELLQDTVQNVVEFANSGFGGSPAFVQNLDGYLAQIQDQTATRFINRLDQIVSLPFHNDVRSALMVTHQRNMAGWIGGYGGRSIVPDPQRFFAGDFQGTGGWAGWMHMTQGRMNNPLGAYLVAQERMNADIRRAMDREMAELSWGSGFRSIRETANAQGRQVAVNTTPGSVIAAQVNNALGAGLNVAMNADAFGQELTGEFEQGLVRLAEQALTGATGMLGLSELAGFNLNNLLNDLLGSIGSELEDALVDLILSLFSDEEEWSNDQGEVIDQGLVNTVRDNIERVLTTQEAFVNELNRLVTIINERPMEDFDQIILSVFGTADLSFLDEIDDNIQRLVSLEQDINNLSAAARRDNQTEVQTLRRIFNEVSILQGVLPRDAEVNALREAINRL